MSGAAAKILIIGGLGSLLFSFVMAFRLALARQADPAADHHLLLQVHVNALWQGFMLLGLVWAVALSDLSSGLETTAALLVVAGTTLSNAATALAWRQNKTNLFEPPLGMTFQLARTNAILAFTGLVILVIGALKGL